MQTIKLDIPGLVLIEPKVFGDARGFFFESFQKERYAEVGITEDFVQDNVSASAKHILRGLHIQNPHSQGKLVQVLEGTVIDIAVDVRLGSPHFGRHVEVELSGTNHRQFYIPPGFAHGFCVTSERAIFHYKCTDYYHPASELSILWNDPALGINWPTTSPSLSKKDSEGLTLEAAEKSGRLPVYQSP